MSKIFANVLKIFDINSLFEISEPVKISFFVSKLKYPPLSAGTLLEKSWQKFSSEFDENAELLVTKNELKKNKST